MAETQGLGPGLSALLVRLRDTALPGSAEALQRDELEALAREVISVVPETGGVFAPDVQLGVMPDLSVTFSYDNQNVQADRVGTMLEAYRLGPAIPGPIIIRCSAADCQYRPIGPK